LHEQEQAGRLAEAVSVFKLGQVGQAQGSQTFLGEHRWSLVKALSERVSNRHEEHTQAAA
jgi:hypothetical protein